MARGQIYLSEPMLHQLEVLRHPARNKVVVTCPHDLVQPLCEKSRFEGALGFGP